MAAAMARGWAGRRGRTRGDALPDSAGRAAKLAAEVARRWHPRRAGAALDVVVLAVKPPRSATRGAARRRRRGRLGPGATRSPLRGLRGPGCADDADDHRRGPARRALHAPLTPADGETGARLLELFGELSHVVELPDESMDAATAVMGCAPAYLALAVEKLAEAGAAEGLGPSWRGSWWSRPPPGRSSCCAATTRSRSAQPSLRPAAAPRPGSRRSSRRRREAFKPAFGPRSRGCAVRRSPKEG